MSRPSSKTQQSIYDNVTLIKPTPNASKEDLEAITEANTTAITLSNAAASAADAGQHIRAIALHRKALAIKLKVYGEESVQAAVSFNSMGESYIKAGRLDDAEEVLQKALYVRDSKVWGGLEMGPREDAAATRDNLAQVLEARGRFDEARALRLKGAERGETMCGNVDCISPGGAMLRTEDLKACGACKAVFYCGLECQKADWKARHRPLCKTYTEMQRTK